MTLKLGVYVPAKLPHSIQIYTDNVTRERPAPEGVTVIRTAKSPTEVAGLYRGALGLVFPSLRETFGMPILEARAARFTWRKCAEEHLAVFEKALRGEKAV